MMLFTFARILVCLNTQSVHTILFIVVNLLSLSQLSPYGSGPASCPRKIKKGKIYICNQIYNEVLLNHFNSEITRQTTHF